MTLLNVLPRICVMDATIVPPGKHGELGHAAISEVHDQCTDNTRGGTDVKGLQLPALNDRFAVDGSGRGDVQCWRSLLIQGRAGGSSRTMWDSIGESCQGCDAGGGEEGE